MVGPVGAMPCPIQHCVLYSTDLAKHLTYHHHFEVTEIRRIVRLLTIRPHEKLAVVKCPEPSCLMTMLEESFQEHLESYHGYSSSQSSIIRLAVSAVPVVPPTLTIEDSSDDDDEEKEVVGTEKVPSPTVEKITLKTALSRILKNEDLDDIYAAVGEGPKADNNTCELPEAEEIPSLGSCGDTEDDNDDAVVISDEEEEKKRPNAEEMSDFVSFKLADDTDIVVYPIIQDVVNWLEENKSGVRFEKKLTGKDIKKLISGEMTFEEFKEIKYEHDRIKEETFGSGSRGSSQREIKRELSLSADEEIASVSSSTRRGGGNKFGRREKKQQEVSRCRLCDSYRLRVVDYERTDGKNILECANRKCLATICLTDKPAGTIIEVPLTSEKNQGWVFDSSTKLHYPDLEDIESGHLTADPELIVPPELEEISILKLPCPGQTSLVHIM